MFTIRQATADDLEILTDLRVAFFEDIGEVTSAQLPAFREATYRYLSHALPLGKFLGWVAEDEGQIIATSGLVFFEQAPIPTNLSGIEAYILNIYTLPAWRGKGVAKALMQQTISYAQSTNVQQFWLYATEQGRPLYEKLGFRAMHDAMGMNVLSIETAQ